MNISSALLDVNGRKHRVSARGASIVRSTPTQMLVTIYVAKAQLALAQAEILAGMGADVDVEEFSDDLETATNKAQRAD